MALRSGKKRRGMIRGRTRLLRLTWIAAFAAPAHAVARDPRARGLPARLPAPDRCDGNLASHNRPKLIVSASLRWSTT